MIDKKNTATGFPLRKQVIGGFNKTDVTEYIETIVDRLEGERRENEERKLQFDELMQNGQAFCDDLAAQAKQDANTLMEETQKEVNALMQDANEQLQQIREEYAHLQEQTQTEMKNLAGIVDHQQESMLSNRKKSRRGFLLVLIILVAAELLLFLFILGGAVVNGDSMLPEMKNGDFVLFNRLKTNPARGEIVVTHSGANGVYYIKRTIALAGDVVDLTSDGGVAVNGVRLDEPYTWHASTTAQDLIFPQTVPPGHIFVLGDNRPISRDSRNSAIGMVSQKNIKGTLMFSIRGTK